MHQLPPRVEVPHMANEQEIRKNNEARLEMLHQQKVQALRRELATAERSGKGDVDAIVAQLEAHGAPVAGKRETVRSRTGDEKRG